MSSSSPRLDLAPLSSAMDGLKLESGTFLYNSSQRRNRQQWAGRTDAVQSKNKEEEDTESFKCLLSTFIPEIVPYLEQHYYFENHQLASIELTVGQPVEIRLVNGRVCVCCTMYYSQPVKSCTFYNKLNGIVSRILPPWRSIISKLHLISWTPYRRLSFRMGRQSMTEGRRAVETVCAQWLLRKNINKSSLGIVGRTGKTMVLRQLIATLAEYHSTVRFAVVSETGELYGMQGGIDIPWQANWLEVVQRAKVQVLVLDAAASMTTTTTVDQLRRGSIKVVASGWRNASLVLHIRTKNKGYRLVRRSNNVATAVVP